METMKLIPMTQFVIEQSEKLVPTKIGEYLTTMLNYAKFLTQPLELWQIIPCSEDGEVLEEPTAEGKNNVDYLFEMDAYNKAKSRCLFEGFTLSEDKLTVCIKNQLFDFHISLDELEYEGYDIECLVNEKLTLTQTAKEMIFGTSR